MFTIFFHEKCTRELNLFVNTYKSLVIRKENMQKNWQYLKDLLITYRDIAIE